MNAPWVIGIGAFAGPWLVRVTLGGLVIALLTLLAIGVMRRAHSRARAMVWRAGILAMLALPLLSLVPAWEWTLPVSSEWLGSSPPAQPIFGAPASASGSAEAGIGSLTATPAATGPADFNGRVLSTDPLSSAEASAASTAGWIVVLWAILAGGILAYFGAGLVTLRLHGRRARDVTAEMAELLPAGRNVRVLRGGPFPVPGCWGLVRPSVLLPVSSKQWSRRRLRAILLHETAHLERRDPLFLLLARLASAIHWVNPLVWYMQRRLLDDGEVACDAEVVGQGVPAPEYARVLLDLAAETRDGHQRLVLSLSRHRGLEGRVVAVLDADRPRPSRRGPATAASLVLATTALACATVAPRALPADTGSAAGVAPAGSPDPAGGRVMEEHAGVWEGRYDGGDELYVQLVDGAGGGMTANHIPLTHLGGLDPALLRGGGDIAFELERAAGTVWFEGRFNAGTGEGTYRFDPGEEYAVEMTARGIEELPAARILLLALQDVDPSFLDDLDEHTTGPIDGDLLVRAAIFDVDEAFMQELAEAGYPSLTVQDLVRMRIFEIDASYVQRLEDGGERPTVDEMVSRRIRERRASGGSE